MHPQRATSLEEYWQRLRRFVWQSPEPVTRTLLLISGLTFITYFIAAFLLGLGNPWRWLSFSTGAPWWAPWSFFTYPLVSYNLFNLTFSGYWLWIVGGSLERAWSSQRFLRFFAGISLASSLSLWLGSLLFGLLGAASGTFLSGLWMPLAGLTVAWCLINPDQIVLFGFILPIRSRQLLWGTFILTYFGFAFASGAPWLAFFALAWPAPAYVYMQQRSGGSLWTQRPAYLRRTRSTQQLRPPSVLEHAWDWLLYWWERLRPHGPRR